MRFVRPTQSISARGCPEALSHWTSPSISDRSAVSASFWAEDTISPPRLPRESISSSTINWKSGRVRGRIWRARIAPHRSSRTSLASPPCQTVFRAPGGTKYRQTSKLCSWPRSRTNAANARMSAVFPCPGLCDSRITPRMGFTPNRSSTSGRRIRRIKSSIKSSLTESRPARSSRFVVMVSTGISNRLSRRSWDTTSMAHRSSSRWSTRRAGAWSSTPHSVGASATMRSSFPRCETRTRSLASSAQPRNSTRSCKERRVVAIPGDDHLLGVNANIVPRHQRPERLQIDVGMDGQLTQLPAEGDRGSGLGLVAAAHILEAAQQRPAREQLLENTLQGFDGSHDLGRRALRLIPRQAPGEDLGDHLLGIRLGLYQ